MSLLPPRTEAKLSKMDTAARREYAQVLLGRYESSLLAIEHRGRTMLKRWRVNQVEHLERVCDELRSIIETG